MFALKCRVGVYLSLQRESRTNGLVDALCVQGGQSTRNRRIKERDLRVGHVQFKLGTGTGKKFGLRQELRMNFNANAHLPEVAGGGSVGGKGSFSLETSTQWSPEFDPVQEHVCWTNVIAVLCATPVQCGGSRSVVVEG